MIQGPNRKDEERIKQEILEGRKEDRRVQCELDGCGQGYRNGLEQIRHQLERSGIHIRPERLN